MRKLEDIQADIKYLLEEKEGIVSSIMRMRKNRLEELRREEFESLNLTLYRHNSTFSFAANNLLQMLNYLTWEMKVVGRTHDARKPVAISGLKGQINDRGYAHCSRLLHTSLVTVYPVSFTGTIDCFGRINLNVEHKKRSVFHYPISFNACVLDNGIMSLDGIQEKRELTFDNQIDSMSGYVFEKNPKLKNQFITERKFLLKMITDNRVK